MGKFAHTQRPARLAEPGPRYQHTGLSYLKLLRSYYLTASVPEHVTKLVNAWGDKKSVVAFIDGVFATLDGQSIPPEVLVLTAEHLERVADALDEDDAEWAARMRLYADEVRGL